MNFQSKKHWKYLLWSAFLVDNVLGIKLQQLQWNMSYWNEKDGRLSFESQLKIDFLPSNNDSRKCLEKSLYFHQIQLQCKYFPESIKLILLFKTLVQNTANHEYHWMLLNPLPHPIPQITSSSSRKLKSCTFTTNDVKAIKKELCVRINWRIEPTKKLDITAIQKTHSKQNFHANIKKKFFFWLGFAPCKAEQPLRGMKLQEKEAQND